MEAALARQNSPKPAPAHDWQAYLMPLLQALKWKGEIRQLHEAVPAHARHFDLEDFRDCMAHLGFASRLFHAVPKTLDARLLPYLIVEEGKAPVVLASEQELASASAEHCWILSFEAISAPVEMNAPLRKTLKRFHPLLKQILLISFLIGGLALAPTFFNMAIYDHIIASGSASSLPMLVIGVMLALAAEIGFRHLRAKKLSYFGARIDHFVSCSVFERLMFLPPLYTERASVSAQLARLRDFESVREFFTGPLATLFFEMPLILIYLIAMIAIGGWLALVPFVLLIAYGALLFYMHGRMKDSSKAAANASSRKHEFLLESVTKLRAIRLSGLEDAWQQRYRHLSGEASHASFRSAFHAQALETASYVLMTLGGIATLGFGVMAVIDKSITTGTLIAAMMLMWRIVTPMQLAYASVTRLQQLAASTKQVQKLLGVAPERDPYAPPAPLPELEGRITFHRVSLRYGPESEPALLGVSFEARPGQIVAVRGSNGSGKSTILKLALGLYQPQSGSVRLDGVDIRQYDPLALRQSIAYVPQQVDLFPGTIRENLLFVDPAATEEACINALAQACALDELNALPNGLDTIIEGAKAEAVSFMFKQRLNLARAYLRPARIMLFDEPSHSLGAENDRAFAEMIARLRGHSTVLLVTHREDHMRLADQLLVLDKGELTHAGPPDQVISLLRGKRS